MPKILLDNQNNSSHDNIHPMVTRSKVGIYKHNFFPVTTNLTMTKPHHVKQALANKLWKELMQ